MGARLALDCEVVRVGMKVGVLKGLKVVLAAGVAAEAGNAL